MTNLANMKAIVDALLGPTARSDALENETTRLGTVDDVQLNTRIRRGRELTVDELDILLRTSALAWREVWQQAFDLVRPGITLTNVKPAGLDTAALQSYLEGDFATLPDGSIAREPGALWYIARLIGLGDGLGGAVLIPLIDDGMDPAEPLDIRRIRRIAGWVVLDRREITPYSTDGREPSYYVLSGAGHRDKIGVGDVWHKSRVWVHEGMPVSDYERRLRGWWGISKLELTKMERIGADSALQYLLGYMHRSSWLAYSIASLNELLDEKDEEGNEIGEEAMRERFHEFRRLITTLGIALLDGGTPQALDEQGQPIPERHPDKVESIAESVGDLPQIHDVAMSRWQRATGMPKSIADGETAPGLRGGENRGDWWTWEGICDARRKDVVTPLLTWVLMLIFASQQGPTHGVMPEAFTIEYGRLIAMSEEEKAKLDETVATTDGLRITQRVATAGEVRSQRMVDGDRYGQLRAKGALPNQAADLLVGTIQAIMEGAISVQSGVLSAPAYEALLPLISNGRVSTAQAQQIASVLAANPAPNPAPPPGAAARSTQTAAPPADVEMSADDEEADVDEEADLLDFSTDKPPPGGLARARTIKEKLHQQGFTTVTVQQIRKLGREREIRQWRTLGGEVEYSLAEVIGVLRKRIAGGQAQDAAEPDLPTIYAWLVEHYSHARKLSAPRIAALLAVRDKYPFLRAPSGAMIYRGLYNVSPAKAGRLIGPTNPVRDKSWTTSRPMARRFAQGEFVADGVVDEGLLCVVMEAQPDPDNVLLDATAIAAIPEVGGHYNELWGMNLADAIIEEAEVLVFGPVQVQRLEVVAHSQPHGSGALVGEAG